MKLCKNKFKEKVGYFYLDAIDWVCNDTDLNNFILPEKTEFMSIKEMIRYAIDNVPSSATESFAQFHYIKNDVIKEETALLFKYYNGSLKTFQI